MIALRGLVRRILAAQNITFEIYEFNAVIRQNCIRRIANSTDHHPQDTSFKL